jgi:dUTP pyrophosphatase
MSYFANSADTSSYDPITMAHTPSIKSQFLSAMSKKCDRCMVLRVFVNGSLALQELYQNAIMAHNLKLIDQDYMDSGFDLYAPLELKCSVGTVNKVDFHIQCASYTIDLFSSNDREFPTGYCLYPRSSLSKTSLRLANSVGIIDSGYRGDVIGMFDCINADYTIKQFDRLAQICAPSLVPIFVEMVRNDIELGATTRGAGGFGSSGR